MWWNPVRYLMEPQRRSLVGGGCVLGIDALRSKSSMSQIEFWQWKDPHYTDEMYLEPVSESGLSYAGIQSLNFLGLESRRMVPTAVTGPRYPICSTFLLRRQANRPSHFSSVVLTHILVAVALFLW